MKKDIAYFMRRLYRQQLTTSSGGNISARGENSVFITPSGIDKARINTEQIGEVAFDGQLIESAHPLSMETAMHLAIYETREDVMAIVHAHPVYATAFASSSQTLDSHLTSEGRYVIGHVAKADYALMGTHALADVVSKAAENSNVILMENHGIIAVGKTLLEAFDRLEVMEFTAKMNFITQNLNMHKPLSKDQLKEIDNMHS